MGFIHPEDTIANALKLALDGRGNIQANYGEFEVFRKEDGINVPGIFVAGDCRRGQSLVVWAINEGRGASKAAHEYLTSLK